MPRTLRSRRHQALIAIIVEARKEARLTQRAFAAKIRLPQSAVSAIESGQRRIDVVEFLDIAKALGVPPLELLARVILR